MNICDPQLHDEIIYNEKYCPLCNAIESIQELESRIKELERYIQELEKEIKNNP